MPSPSMNPEPSHTCDVAQAVPAGPQPVVSRLQRIEDCLVGLLGVAALLVCLANVMLRNLGSGHALSASDEIQVYLIVWAVFLSLGVVTASNRHIKADIFLNWFSPGVKRAASLFSVLLGLAFSMLMTYLGMQITIEAFEFGDVSSTSLRFPLWIYTAALPAGMALMSLRYAMQLTRHIWRAGGGEA